jgi:aryl-alcohol dehydrogenase-like predicted oxidoreductase
MVEQSRRRFLGRVILGATGALGACSGGAPSTQSGQDAVKKSTVGGERRRLGKTDMEVSVLGFGGAEIGYERTDQAVVDKLLNSALDAGLNVIDTAECYIDSEGAIGRAVSKRRRDYFLFTKVGHWPEDGWTKAGIERSLERSLTRLQTDCVDLVQLHSCGKDVLQRGEVIEALEKARQAGKTRYIGYSGDREDALFAVECGRFDTLQTSVSVFDQQAIDLTLPMARTKQMGVICKRPIGNAVWRYDARPANGYHVDYWQRMVKLGYAFCAGDMRRDAGPEGAAGVALRFTLGIPGVHTAIVGTTNPERFRQNAALAAAGPLPEAQMASIRARWKEIAEAGWVGQT